MLCSSSLRGVAEQGLPLSETNSRRSANRTKEQLLLRDPEQNV